MNIRLPFDPPYYRDDLPQLDALHNHIGLGPEWLASDARAAIPERPAIEKPCGGRNSNVCVAEGCFGEACVNIASDRTE